MFTLRDIKAAYAKHGLKPCANSWGDVCERTACPLTALCFGSVDLRKVPGYITREAADILNLTFREVDYFRNGIDGWSFSFCDDDTPEQTEKFRRCYHVGRLARRFINNQRGGE